MVNQELGPCLLAAGGYIAEVVDVPGELEPNTNYFYVSLLVLW